MAKVKILIVEDNRIVAEDLKNSLEEMGYEVISIATTGELALQAVQQNQPDITLMDIRLGKGMNGIETADQLKNYNIPVVYLTAHADQNTLAKAKLTEPYGYLVKPFDIDELQSAVEIAVYKHQAEHKIKEHRQWLETTLTSIGDGVIATDEKGCVKFMNPVAEELTGWKQQEAYTKPLDEVFRIINEQTRAIVENPVQKVIETGQIVGLANHTVLISKDGREIPIKDSGAPILLDRTYLDGVVLVFQDDTESRLAKNKLRHSKERLRLAMESANEGAWEFNPKTQSMHFDDLCLKLLGFDDSPIANDAGYQWWLQRIHPEDRQKVESTLQAFEPDKENHSIIDYRLECRNGKYLWINSRATLVPASPGNNEKIILGILRDISERKSAEAERDMLQGQLRQAQKVEAVGTLAGGIAHDFNNILASIIGFTELSLDEAEKGSILYENLGDILTSGIRARDLVRQILMFSRHVESEFKPVELNTLVSESLKLMRATIPTFVDIVEEIATSPITVFANSSQINQILINLCTNGFHAMEGEKGTLKICLDTLRLNKLTRIKYTEIPAGNYARLIVQDTGKGIQPDDMEKIFDPYFTTKEQDRGTGLGLSIVQGIVKSHNGQIFVDSLVRHGTTFSIYLPLLTIKHSEKNPEKRSKLPGGNETILFVDDEPTIVKMQKQNLRRMGYQVDGTTSATEALESIMADPDKYDLIITDMAMPGMSGDILASNIKKIRQDIRIILCTGFSEKIDRATLSELELDGYLLKPVEKAKMLLTIRQVLDLA